MSAPLPKPNLDSVTTIRADGSRFFLHPADSRGKFLTARRWSGWFLIVIYLALPWIPVGGHPAVFLDIADRRFHLFGWTLAFQDAWLLFFGITGLGFALFFITSLLGRMWCGWACPQTVFLEHVYRRIERLIEGDAQARRALDQASWTPRKLFLRGTKQVLFFAVSAVIAHLFLAYYVSLPELWTMMRTAPGEHWSAFVFVFIFTAVLYFNFAWFREQLCLIICPYGRMQSVLVDDNSLVIGYDAKRGEPRGKLGTPDAGACINCSRCVQVCPTGIDIRQGLQLECIACSACVDACDEVMTKINRPTGLVRYDSLNGLNGKKTRWIRPRIVVYAVIMAIGGTVASIALSSVRPASLSVTRITGAPYITDDTSVRNQFFVRIVNKRSEPARFILTVENAPAAVQHSGFETAVELPALAEQVRPLIVQLAKGDYEGPFEIKVVVADEAHTFTLSRDVQFLGPDVMLLQQEEAARARRK